MNTEVKMLVGVGLVTAIIIGGGAYFGSRSNVENIVPADSERLVRSDSYTISADNDKVILVEFADFQCEACRAAHPVIKQLMEEYKGKVKFVWRYFPLPGHKNSVIATQAAEAAGEQGKFWEMNDTLFENQHIWGNEQNLPSEQQANEMFIQYARDLGLNADQFKQAIESKKFTDKINRDKSDGLALGVNATPTFFLNGKKSPGVPTYQQLKALIETELRK